MKRMVTLLYGMSLLTLAAYATEVMACESFIEANLPAPQGEPKCAIGWGINSDPGQPASQAGKHCAYNVGHVSATSTTDDLGLTYSATQNNGWIFMHPFRYDRLAYYQWDVSQTLYTHFKAKVGWYREHNVCGNGFTLKFIVDDQEVQSETFTNADHDRYVDVNIEIAGALKLRIEMHHGGDWSCDQAAILGPTLCSIDCDELYKRYLAGGAAHSSIAERLYDEPSDNNYYIQISVSTLMIIGGLISVILIINVIFLCRANCCSKKTTGYKRVKFVDADTECVDSEANLVS